MHIGIFCILLCITSAGDIYEQSFRDANDAYYKKDFLTAIQKYEKLISSGVEHPVIFYNLGNAYYHYGKKGMAIANYERALDLNPSFKPAQDNLNKVLNETKRKLAIPEEPLWLRYLFIWHFGMPLKWTWGLSLIFWLIGWTILSIFMWVRREYRKPLFIIGTIIILISIVFFISALIKINAKPLGVIIVTQSTAHITPSDASPSRFDLFEGDRVKVEHEEGSWTLISTVDNTTGWIRSEDIFIWKPPYRSSEHLLNTEEKVSS